MSGSSPPPVPVTSLFSEQDAEALRADRLLFVARRYLPKITVTDAYLLEKLRAAEAEFQRALRCLFTRRTILPDFALQPELDAAAAAGLAVLQEPGYDYDPSLFSGNSYGFIATRQRPIISVESIVFAYPLPSDTAYTVPQQWIRPDKKYGIINLVPVNTASFLPLDAYLLSVLGGGQITPFLMQIRYTAGLANARVDFPDLVDTVKKMAVLSVIEDLFLPQSASTGTDGLSQTFSVSIEEYQKRIEQKTTRLRSALSGVRMLVC